MLGACGQTLKPGNDFASLNNRDRTPPATTQSVAKASVPAAPGGVSEDLLKATEYWGQMYAKSPRELEPALNYARNLKAMGEKRKALSVLQQAGLYHGQSRELASEYGRLALDLDQVSVAKQLLAIADDPAKPDWRVVSARGAAFAKEGNYNDAIPFFQRALELSPDQPSVMNNLALAYAMNGEPGKGESMLRQASATDANSPRIRQNLALVLGLQGKYDEAKLVAARDIPMNNASENADYLRQVVKLDPKSMPDSTPQPWDTQSKIAEAPVADAVPVEKVAKLSGMPPAEPPAAGDAGWVIEAPASQAVSARPAAQDNGTAPPPGERKVLSVADMAARFAAVDETTPTRMPALKSTATDHQSATTAPQAEPEAWNSQIAQVKR
jgi:Flp pilus assembly protein TadD